MRLFYLARTLALVALLGAHSWPVLSWGATERRFQQVAVEGVKAISAAEIEAEMEIASGDIEDSDRIERTVQNLLALYRSRGFERAQVVPRVLEKRSSDGKMEHTLELKVTEGLPNRIAELVFTAPGIREGILQKFWLKLQKEIQAKLTVKPGEVLDSEKLSQLRIILNEAFLAEELVNYRLDDVVVEQASPPAGWNAREALKSRWVRLTYRLQLGERVTFGFRGNSVIPTTRLNAIVEEQRALGLGKEYIGIVQRKVEEEYLKLGYAGIQIRASSIQKSGGFERHVTFRIREGDRIELEAVQFDGNTVFSSERLEKEFLERAAPVIKSGYYVDKDAQSAAESLISWIKSEGYLSAKLIALATTPSQTSSKINQKQRLRLVVYLYEGDQSVVHAIRYNGLSVLMEKEANSILGIEVGRPLDLFRFSAGIETLKARIRAKGFLGVAITNEGKSDVIAYSDENRHAAIQLTINEGPLFRVSQIEVDGLQQTRSQVVYRELPFVEGDVLEEPLLLEAEERLRRLGIFSNVTVRALEDALHPDRRRVRIAVEEATPGVLATGLGLRNDLGIRLFGQTGYTNIRGRNQSLLLSATLNRRFEDYRFLEAQGQLAYIWPWFLGSEVTFRPQLTGSRTQFIRFDADNITLSTTFERRILRKPNLITTLSYSIEYVNQTNAKVFQEDNNAYRIGAITPGLRLDMRDNPLNPTTGLFASASFEYAAPWLLSQSIPLPLSYTRFLMRTDGFIPLKKDYSLFLSFRTGYLRNLQPPVTDPNTGEEVANSGSIPIIKQFVLGGVGSLRGFSEQELNTANLLIRGTATYVNFRSQLDLPFSGALRVGPFLDAANLNVDEYSLNNMRFGYGAGFHYQTPVGPVNLDFGFKFRPLPSEDPWKIYFSIGVI